MTDRAALSLRGWRTSLRGAHPAIGAWDGPVPMAVGLWRLLQKVSPLC